MKFAADECCDALIVGALRAEGHDVWYASESAGGADDESVLNRAATEERVLLTEDKDFGELVIRLGLPAYGIVLLRMNPADSESKLGRLREVLTSDADRIPGAFVVVDERKTRFRPIQ